TTGNIAVAWYDARNAGSADNTAQIFAAISTDGGLTFSANVQVSSGTSNSATSGSGIDYGDYMLMDYANGAFYPIWSDNSATLPNNPNLPTLDIATARVTVASVSTHFQITANPSSVHAGQASAITVTLLAANNIPA